VGNFNEKFGLQAKICFENYTAGIGLLLSKPWWKKLVSFFYGRSKLEKRKQTDPKPIT
jgi:hypothetical protein